MLLQTALFHFGSVTACLQNKQNWLQHSHTDVIMMGHLAAMTVHVCCSKTSGGSTGWFLLMHACVASPWNKWKVTKFLSLHIHKQATLSCSCLLSSNAKSSPLPCRKKESPASASQPPEGISHQIMLVAAKRWIEGGKWQCKPEHQSNFTQKKCWRHSHKQPTHSKEATKTKVDEAGIEPATLCMLSTRATNCATRPNWWVKLPPLNPWQEYKLYFYSIFYSNIFMRVPLARWRHALARSFRLALLRLALLARSSVVRWKWKFEETQQCSLLLSLVAK